ncbi:MAG: tyrosine-protein kinase family protein, partial [Thermodesulfobacteriota bacterium]
VNLSLAMMKELNMRVLLMECDMRSPSFGDYFEFSGDIPGLREVLDGEAGLDDSVARVDGTNLYVMHGGRDVRSMPGSMNHGMKKLMERVRIEFDYVILDTPPIAPVADVNILSKFVDGLIMIVRADSTPRDMVIKAVHSMPDADIVGIVLNRINRYKLQYY